MEIYDHKKAMAVTDGDESLLRELLLTFRQTRGEMINNLEKSIETREADRVRRIAHSLKGSLSNLGGVAASAAARELEMLGAAGSLDQADECLKGLIEEVEKFDAVSAAYHGLVDISQEAPE